MKTFAETPEGKKYLAKLQEGDGKRVPDGMDGLEAQAFKMFTKSRLRAGAIIAEREKTLQGIVEAEERVKALTRQGDMATGEARASAEILLAAEEVQQPLRVRAHLVDALGDAPVQPVTVVLELEVRDGRLGGLLDQLGLNRDRLVQDLVPLLLIIGDGQGLGYLATDDHDHRVHAARVRAHQALQQLGHLQSGELFGKLVPVEVVVGAPPGGAGRG
ncbi:hypothetical protein LCGC14_2008730, partial [marine sediment metagenome]